VPPLLDQLIGVYDADSTLIGEVSYWVGARLGRRHCSLCDVTHGLFTEKSEWRECRDELPLPFVTYHRNDMPDDVRQALGSLLPAVVVRRGGVVQRLLSSTEIESAGGNPEELVRLLSERLGEGSSLT